MANLTRIRDVLARDLDRRIEEIIKVNQRDPEVVHTELTEYVVTDRISAQYRTLLKAMAEAPAEPDEGVGVWISGFFGSGKSSFAKNLGYALGNFPVLGRPAAELFKDLFSDPQVRSLVDSINARIPTEVVMFDVSVDAAVRRESERIGEIIYTVLLRELDYAEDFDVAELEIELEGEGRLAEFEERCREMYGDWRTRVRKGAQKVDRASAVLHAVDPATYPAPDSWARSIAGRPTDITVAKLVERAFSLTARRRPGRALVLIIDEVGQHVARSGDKIEDLRAVVEQFGKESRNRVKARQALAPVWVVVTSQEKLDEVVAAIDSKRVELARLQDRFKYHIDLAPADIRQVATQRVLAKREDALPLLRQLFAHHQGQLNAAVRLERTSRRSDVTEEAFVQFYPYLPHFIELSIDIMSGIRLQPGAARHLGGSNRTIIKQAYEMLVSERTRLADQPLGTLVTLDRVFELVEGNLSSEKQKDISDIALRFKGDPAAAGMALRAARALCLLEFVHDLPRTPANIAAMLVDRVDSPAPLAEVEGALKRLKEAQFVREAEEGYKLQTAQEKNWEAEKRGHLDPRPKDRNDIKREILGEIFADPRVRTYQGRRTLKLGIVVDGTRVGEEGDVAISVVVADDGEGLPSRREETRDTSRQPAHVNDLYWAVAVTQEIDDLVAQLFASRQMLNKYEQARAQNRITAQELDCLAGERLEAGRLQSRLREKVAQACLAGTSLFRGVSRDGSSLGKTVSEVVKALLDLVVPDLYPKLAMGARPLRGNEAEEVLKAANLNALPQVLYGGEQGLNLVVQEGGKYMPNSSADIAREVLEFLRREHSYGNKVTGKTLEEHFGGFGYGWERDILRLVLAVLLRAGSLEVTHQGRRFRSHQDPQSRAPFTNNVAFRAASFAPREALGIRALTTAVEHLEALTGSEVDVEEGAIASAFKKLAGEETALLLPLEATARARELPILGVLEEYRGNLQTIQNADSDDCVRILAGEGQSFKQTRDRIRQMRTALDEAGLRSVTRARHAVEEMWPTLERLGEEGDLPESAADLAALLRSDSFYVGLPQLTRLAASIASRYEGRYRTAHERRSSAALAAIEEIKGRAEWPSHSSDMQAMVLAPLASRACDPPILSDGAIACSSCRATIPQMGSDLAALPALKAQALARLQELTSPEDRVARVRLADFFTGPLGDRAAIDQAIERLREHLHNLMAEGARIIVD